MEAPESVAEEEAEPKRWQDSIPAFAFLWRAFALALIALFAGRLAFGVVRASLLLLPVAIVLLIVGLLAAWGSAVHFAGGQKFDDQTWH